MSKRPAIDLSSLTSEAAAPMPEASQRSAHVVTLATPPSPAPAKPVAHAADARRDTPAPEPRTRTENLEALAFKVSPAFRKRFRQRAVDADLKLNELLFEALDEWEKARKIKN